MVIGIVLRLLSLKNNNNNNKNKKTTDQQRVVKIKNTDVILTGDSHE